ncbi:hypothetical protein Dsin_002672 [Dipteronia sinensis]|uniref:Uncharacterized protein n=1 Tax=Dipteronia sinensis TaxID=43782 RepID=A0AAE0B6M5_9ROSI|nr:hypothetical protein Dsin_002672 [Dipteronia sinensis]
MPGKSRIVGLAAFTRNHQWILANNHIRDAHPPENLCNEEINGELRLPNNSIKEDFCILKEDS